MIDAHGVAGFLKSLGRQTAGHELQDRLARCKTQLLESQAVAVDVHLRVVPASPLASVKRKTHQAPLLCTQKVQHRQGSLHHGLHRGILGLSLKETWHHLSVGGDPQELLCIKLVPGIKQQRFGVRIGQSRISMLVGVSTLKSSHPWVIQSGDKRTKIFRISHLFISQFCLFDDRGLWQ